MVITKSIYSLLISELSTMENKTTENARKLIFSAISKNDIIPDELIIPVKKLVLTVMYDRTGKGYKGIVNEIEKRIETIRYTEKVLNWGGIPFSEFLLRRLGSTDTVDFDNHSGFEEKSGCGNWLYSYNGSFDETVKMYRRKKTIIRWDYQFDVDTKKNGKEHFNIYIETTYKLFFDFLSDYSGGFKTWWKENARSGNGCFVWELQNIPSSRKKAVYLTTFDEWLKSHK